MDNPPGVILRFCILQDGQLRRVFDVSFLCLCDAPLLLLIPLYLYFQHDRFFAIIYSEGALDFLSPIAFALATHHLHFFFFGPFGQMFTVFRPAHFFLCSRVYP